MQFTPYRPWSEERKLAASSWTGKKAWLVEQMWGDGCTFKEIGAAISASRSSVAGFVRRRGLHRKISSHEVLKSAPESTASQNNAEGEPVVMQAHTGADTSERSPPTAQQLERIGHRRDIIRGLTRAIEQSSDPSFIERANWMIEQKKFEIESILFQTTDATV